MNRSPRPPERYPQPRYPRIGLTTAVAAPLVVLVPGLLTGALRTLGFPLGTGAVVPVGFVIWTVTAFPLMMPADVRYLAAVVSTALLGLLAVVLSALWSWKVGFLLLPVVSLMVFVWAANRPAHVRGLGRTPGPAQVTEPESSGSGDPGERR